MLDRMACGDLPAKHHLALTGKDGALRYEECVTRAGFDGPYSILYHQNRPHALDPAPTPHVSVAPRSAAQVSDTEEDRALRRRHYRSARLSPGGAPLDARVPLLFSEDVTIGSVHATASDPAYFVNADADELFFVRRGAGTLRSPFGDLRFEDGDYLCVPKGVLHRFVLDAAGDGSTDVELLAIECRGGVGLPKQWRNETGQIRMDAPFCHRDFRRPVFRGPLDEGIRDLVVKRGDLHHGFRFRYAPLDVVGWDGTVYPWVFPILAFQPRVGAVHLPPTWHGTFAARGALICSFVPRPLDFHPDAVPCPYPHASVDVDEVIYYVSGDFGSRRGVEAGSLTLHPRGLPHGPHPGRYEESRGARRTEEVAVMLDCYAPLTPTVQARNVEDVRYESDLVGD